MSTVWDLYRAEAIKVWATDDIAQAVTNGSAVVSLYVPGVRHGKFGAPIPAGYWIVFDEENNELKVYTVDEFLRTLAVSGHVQLTHYKEVEYVNVAAGSHVIKYGSFVAKVYGNDIVRRLTHRFDLVPQELTSPMPSVKYGEFIVPVLCDHKTPAQTIYDRKHWCATYCGGTYMLAIFATMDDLVAHACKAGVVPVYGSDDYSEPTIVIAKHRNVYPKEYKNFPRLMAALRGEPYVEREPIGPFDKPAIVLRETGEAIFLPSGLGSYESDDERIVRWLKENVLVLPTAYEYEEDASGFPCIKIGPYDVYGSDGSFGCIKQRLESK